MEFHSGGLIAVAFGLGGALITTGPSASAQSSCPGLRGVNRNPAILESMAGVRGERALSVLGLRISFGSGTFCPDTMTVTPAHRECEPVENSNTDCKATAPIEVRLRNCSCATKANADLGINQSNCVCRYAGDAGWVYDHETLPCLQEN
jgi:hypothetical protein